MSTARRGCLLLVVSVLLGLSGLACQQNSSFGVNSACEPNPCQNGAECSIAELSQNANTNETIYGYKCACSTQFTGDNCEIDLCSPDFLDCQNDSTCEVQTDPKTQQLKAVCVCVDGFTGLLCNVLCDSAVSCGKQVTDCTTNADTECSSQGLVCVPDPEASVDAQKCSLPVEASLPCNHPDDCVTGRCTVNDDISIGSNAGVCDCVATNYGEDCSYQVATCAAHGNLVKVKNTNLHGYCLCNPNYFGFTCGTNITTANLQVTNLANQTTLYTHNGQTYANIGYNLDFRPLGTELNGSQFSMFMATSATGALSICTAAVAGSGTWHAYPVSGSNTTSGVYAYYIDSTEHANKGFYYLRFKDPHDTLSDCLAVTTPVWYGDKSCSPDTGSLVAHASFTSAAFNPSFPLVTGSCDLGYQGSGSITPKAYCEKDGTYAVVTGACYPGDCGLASRPALPSHAVYLNIGTIYTGNAISAACASGYSSPSTAALVGSIKCEVNGTSGVVWGTGRITGGCLGNSGAVCATNSDCFEVCINGVCKGKSPIGGSCDERADCLDSNALCNTGSQQCIRPGLGFSCAGDGDCDTGSNIHCSSPTSGTCGGATALCVNNQGCNNGANLYCLPTGDAVNKTQACGLPVNAGGKCNSNADCTYNNCTVANDDNFTGSILGVCGGSGVVCHSGNIECDATATSASARFYCRPSGSGQLCLPPGIAGASCNDHGDCVDGNCTATDSVSLTGVCGGAGLPCTSNSGCASGTVCAPGAVSGHYCVTPAIGGRCDANDDCPTSPMAISCGSGGICGGSGAVCTTNAGCDTSGISTSQAVKYTCAPKTLGSGTSECRDKSLLNAPCDNVDGAADCDISQRCAPVATAGTSGALYQCTTPVLGSVCEDDTDCNISGNLYCSETTSGVPHGTCGGSGARCTVNTDCYAGANLSCLPGTGNLYCLARSTTGGICNDHADCSSTVSGNYDVKCSVNTTTLTTGYCGGLNASCGSSAGSAIATTAANLQCSSGYTCVNTTCTTYAGLNSGTCDDHADCLGGLKCSSTGALPGTTGVCGGSGSICTSNTGCNTGANLYCIPDSVGTGQTCALRSTTGGRCNLDSDCNGSYCTVNTDTATGTGAGYCGNSGAVCNNNSQCNTGASWYCIPGAGTAQTCNAKSGLGGKCNLNVDCINNNCSVNLDTAVGTAAGYCGGSGATCSANSQCDTGGVSTTGALKYTCAPTTLSTAPVFACRDVTLLNAPCDNADGDSDCATSQKCAPVATAGTSGALYQCTTPVTGSICEDNTDCNTASNLYCSDTTSGVPHGICGGSGARCTVNTDCNTGSNMYCIPDVVGTGQTCVSRSTVGGRCNLNVDCTNNNCSVNLDTAVGTAAGYCGGSGATCSANSQCDTGGISTTGALKYTCAPTTLSTAAVYQCRDVTLLNAPCDNADGDSDCATSQKCAPVATGGTSGSLYQCTTPVLGSICEDNTDCNPASNLYCSQTTSGVPHGTCGGSGAVCTSNAYCDTASSFYCIPGAGTAQTCNVKSGLGGKCNLNVDCTNNNCTVNLDTAVGTAAGYCGGSGATCSANNQCDTGGISTTGALKYTCAPTTLSTAAVSACRDVTLLNAPCDNADGDSDCATSQKCAPVATGGTSGSLYQCTTPVLGSICEDNTDCNTASNLYCSQTTSGVPHGTCGGSGAVCTSNAYCDTAANLYCIPGVSTGQTCAVKSTAGGRCNLNVDCTNNNCSVNVDTAVGTAAGYCGGSGATCSANNQCDTGGVSTTGALKYTCAPTTLSTAAVSACRDVTLLNAPCDNADGDSDCATSQKCAPVATAGTSGALYQCTTPLTGSICEDNTDCNTASNLYCSDTTSGVPHGICGGSGARCTVNTDCNTGASLSCLPGTGNLYCGPRSVTGGICNDNADCSNTVGGNYDVKCSVNTASLTTGYCGGINASCGSSAGSAIAPTAANLQCASGYTCVNTTCTTYASLTSGTCDDNADCLGGLKCSSTGALPGSTGACGGSGAVCALNTDCNTGANLSCLPGTGNLYCLGRSTLGGICNDNADCSSTVGTNYDVKCSINTASLTTGYCGGLNASCGSSSGSAIATTAANTQCTTGYTCVNTTCTTYAGLNSGTCDDNADCLGGVKCSSTGALPGSTGACGGSGAICTSNAGCNSTANFYCIPDSVGTGQTCTTVSVMGGRCNANADCTGSNCSVTNDSSVGTAAGLCGGTGALCTTSSNCLSNYCRLTDNTCRGYKPISLSYTDNPVVYTASIAINPNLPKLVGDPTGIYYHIDTSVSPSLPLNLTLDPTSGVISGTPLSAKPSDIYTIVATNPDGAEVRTQLTLTINPLSGAVIVTQPLSQTVPTGQVGVFTVVATGASELQPLTYQWQKDNVAISGALSNSYQTPIVTSADNGSVFRVVVTDAYGGKLISDPAILVVTDANGAIGTYSRSCSEIKNANPTALNGVYTIDPDGPGGNSEFKVYCDMTTTSGGWTLVVAQYEADPLSNWNEGLQADYMVNSAAFTASLLDTYGGVARSFVLNSGQLPTHTQTAFGKGSDPTYVGYSDVVYKTGDIYSGGVVNQALQLPNLKTGEYYLLHRAFNGYFFGHEPQRNWISIPSPQLGDYTNTLTYELMNAGTLDYSWSFAANAPSPAVMGFGLLGDKTATSESYAWTVWVRGGGGTGSYATSTISLNYAANPVVYTMGVAITPNSASYQGGAPLFYAISPDLPSGLVLNKNSGVLSGTPLTAKAQTAYKVVAANAINSVSTTLTLTVNNPALSTPPSSLSYTPSTTMTYYTQTLIYSGSVNSPPLVPTYAGGTPTAYSITPNLPVGMVLDTRTGIIDGVPLNLSSNTSYTVVASNAAGSASVVLQLTVQAPTSKPANFAYKYTPVTYQVGIPITTANIITGNVNWRSISYSIAPTLPSGLIFNDLTGDITGTPLAVSSATNYTVNMFNSAGTGTGVVNITVTLPPAPTSITYPLNPAVYYVGKAIDSSLNRPVVLGGAVASYAISPTSLPSGIIFNSRTGELSGTPLQVATLANYTISAINTGGSATASLGISVHTLVSTGGGCNNNNACTVGYCSTNVTGDTFSGVCGGTGAVCGIYSEANSGANLQCASNNTCINQVCQPKPIVSYSCDDNADCSDGSKCSVNGGSGGICGGAGASCSTAAGANSQCATGSGLSCMPATVSTSSLLTCKTLASVGSPCNDSGDCATISGQPVYCSLENQTQVGGICGGSGAICPSSGNNVSCASGYACVPSSATSPTGAHVCKPPAVGGTCDLADGILDCPVVSVGSNPVAQVQVNCGTNSICGSTGAACSSSTNTSSVTSNAQCLTASGLTCIYPACAPKSAAGGPCDDDADCSVSNVKCSINTAPPGAGLGVCGGYGAACAVATDCMSGGNCTSGSCRLAPSGLNYFANPAIYYQGYAINANVPTISNGAGVTYSVTPALPAGISLDPTFGTITGTPTVITGPPIVTTGTTPGTGYLVRASNNIGTAAVRVNFEVRDINDFIISPPTDETILIGNPVTFGVGAYSTTACSYQWQRNGVDIPGAISSFYTPTTSVTTGDDGSIFTVRVTLNDPKSSVGVSIVSSGARLTVAKWDGAKQIFPVVYGTCGLSIGRKVKCWGDTAYDVLGYSVTTGSWGISMKEMQFNLPYLSFSPAVINANRYIKDMCGNYYGSYCVTLSDGQGLCWGNNDSYNLGLADVTKRYTPISSDLIINSSGVPIKQVSCEKGLTTCLLLYNGEVRCFGTNSYGEVALGFASANVKATDTANIDFGRDQVNNKLIAKKIFPSRFVVCSLFTNGKMKCWGQSTKISPDAAIGVAPSRLALLDLGSNKIINVSDNIADMDFACLLFDDQKVKCFGYDVGATGILGADGLYEDSYHYPLITPSPTAPYVNLGTNRTVKDVGYGGMFTNCALMDDSSVKCWGRNDHGKLGIGDQSTRGATSGTMGDNLPSVALGPLGTVRSLARSSFGPAHECVILDNGNIKCWGGNVLSALGLGLGVSATKAHGDYDSDPDHRMGEDLPLVPFLAPPNGLRYKFNPVTYVAGVNIVVNSAVVGTTGKTLTYSIVPSLPAGLSLDTTNGLISGTPTLANANALPTDYVVTVLVTSGGNEMGSASSLLNITVLPAMPPKITQQPLETTVISGNNAIFNVYATGSGTLTYQWQYKAAGAGTFSNISGANAASYTMPTNLSNDGDVYRVIVTDANASSTSSGAQLWVVSNDRAVQVAVGSGHTCVVSASKKLKCFGLNSSGQLGYADNTDRSTPSLGVVNVSGTPISVAKVVAGPCHTCVLGTDQNVRCFGCNDSGQLGVNSTTALNAPTSIVNIGSVQDLAAGGIDSVNSHTCVVLVNGDVKCFGNNVAGRLGYGDTTNRGTSAYPIEGLPRINLGTDELGNNLLARRVAIGGSSTCVLLANKSLKCFGFSGNGQLGYGGTTNRGDTLASMGDNLPFVDLGSYRDGVLHAPWLVEEVVLGNQHVCAKVVNGLNSYQMLKCFGLNDSGQLGYGDALTRGNTFTAITNPDSNPVKGSMGDYLPLVDLGYRRTVQKATTFGDSVCALLDNGNLKCFGKNDTGQLGYGNSATAPVYATTLGKVMRDYLPPVSLGTGALTLDKLVTSSSANAKHSCVIYSDGSLKCFGNNASAQLGYGDTTTRGNSTAVSDSNLPNVNLGFPW